MLLLNLVKHLYNKDKTERMGKSVMGLFKKKKKVILEFCTNNLNQFYDDDLFDELEELINEQDYQVKEMDCLSYCDECTCSPYVLVNSTFVEAETPRELIMKLKEKNT